MDVVRRIGVTPTSKPNDRPIKPITLESVKILTSLEDAKI
jgi:hypothetical protein